MAPRADATPNDRDYGDLNTKEALHNGFQIAQSIDLGSAANNFPPRRKKKPEQRDVHKKE